MLPSAFLPLSFRLGYIIQLCFWHNISPTPFSNPQHHAPENLLFSMISVFHFPRKYDPDNLFADPTAVVPKGVCEIWFIWSSSKRMKTCYLVFFPLLNISSHFDGFGPRRSLSTITAQLFIQRERQRETEQNLSAFIGFFYKNQIKLTLSEMRRKLVLEKKRASDFVPPQPVDWKVKEHYWFSKKPFTPL